MVAIRDTTESSGTSCSLKPTKLPRGEVVSVDGVAIPHHAIAREVQNHPAAKPVDAWKAAARALVVRELLLQEARRRAIQPVVMSDEDGRRETADEAVIRQLVEQEVTTPEPDEATCSRYYEQNRQRFRSSDLYAVRHILFAAPPTDEAARTSARLRAEAVIADVAASPGSFAAYAETQSACPSRAMGGNLGQISRGQTVPEFEAALSSAPVGTVCPTPIETRYGLHVVLVEQRIEGQQLPFSVAHARIAEWLAEKARHTAIHQYITMLADRATITGIEFTSH